MTAQFPVDKSAPEGVIAGFRGARGASSQGLAEIEGVALVAGFIVGLVIAKARIQRLRRILMLGYVQHQLGIAGLPYQCFQ